MKKKHKKIRRAVEQTDQVFFGYEHRRHRTNPRKSDTTKKRKEFDLLIKESEQAIKNIKVV